MFGFGAAGVAAAEMAAAACCALCDYEDPKWLAVRGGMQSGSDAANVVLASEWSFSVLCCDGTDENALSEAEATARALVQRGHMAVVMEAGPSAPLMNAPYQMADGRDLPAHLCYRCVMGLGALFQPWPQPRRPCSPPSPVEGSWGWMRRTSGQRLAVMASA
ncbi:hypothetical protein ACFQU2_00535 [Siccirubricoccus deserti]